MPQTITCKQCGHERDHYGFGMCKNCYQRDRYARTPKRKGECPTCHRIMRLYTRNMCSTCYVNRNNPTYTPPTDNHVNLDEWRDYINQCREGKDTQ